MSKEKLVDISPFKKEIQKYLCEGYSPKEISKWIKEQSDNEDDYISEATLRNYKKEYCPQVKWNRKKLVKSERPQLKQSTIQTNFTVPESNVTPEWLVQQFLNEIAKRLPTFKDGNLVQGLNAVARLINDKELEVVDVENTMRKFVSNDKLKEKVNNARYD